MSPTTTITTHDDLYRSRVGKSSLVEVPAARFLMIDGSGRPDGERFQQAVGALYAIAYTAKFALKKAGGPDAKVPPLEGLYDVLSDPSQALDARVRERLHWTLMIRLPEPLDDALVETARAEAARKKSLPAVASVRVQELDERTCAQVLHVGPYSEEPATVETLRAFIAEEGRTPRGASPRDLPERPRAHQARTDEDDFAPAGELKAGGRRTA